jgi:hypothetical protein
MLQTGEKREFSTLTGSRVAQGGRGSMNGMFVSRHLRAMRLSTRPSRFPRFSVSQLSEAWYYSFLSRVEDVAIATPGLGEEDSFDKEKVVVWRRSRWGVRLTWSSCFLHSQ